MRPFRMGIGLAFTVCLHALGQADVITRRDLSGWADDFAEVDEWRARADWLSNPDATAKVSTDGRAACFQVDAAGRGMKWSRAIRPVSPGETPYFFLRYRAVNLATQSADYLVTADAGIAAMVRLRDAKADGQWQFVAVDVRALTSAKRITAVIIQVQATAAGRARLWIDEIGFAESPPQEAVLLRGLSSQPAKPDVSIPVNAEGWHAQPGWLRNPADRVWVGRAASGGRVAFFVDQSGMGMKWQHSLDRPLDLTGHRFLALRYRAKNLAEYGDYALCLLGKQTSAGLGYEEAIRGTDLRSSGHWRTAVVGLGEIGRRMPSADGIAVQVQAEAAPAELVIDSIRLVHIRPVEKLSEMVELRNGADFAGFGPVDLSRVCNQSLPHVLRALRISDWPMGRDVSLYGVPFRLVQGDSPLAATGVVAKGELSITVGCRASQIFLFLLGVLRGKDEDIWGAAPFRRIADVDRFRLRLVYEDGTIDECFPGNVSTGQFEVLAGPQVLCAFADGRKVVKTVNLVDGTDRAAFAVAGVTCRTGGKALWSQFDETTPSPAHQRGEQPTRRGTLLIEPRAGDDGLKRGVRPFGRGGYDVGAIRGSTLQRQILEDSSPHPFFTVTLNGKTLPRNRLRLTQAISLHQPGRAVWLSAVFVVLPCPGVQFHLSAEVVNGSELRFRGTLVNKGQRTYRLGLTCPTVRPYVLGSNPAEAEYVFPCRSAIIGRENASLSTRYGGLFGVQFMAMINAGTFFYLRTEDTTCIERNYELVKDDEGVTMAVRYPERPLAPGQTRELANTIIAAGDGDWHTAFDAYRAWLKTWYKPASPRKQWFREVFNFRQRFLHGSDPLYDAGTGRIDLARAVVEDREKLGGLDYLHLFDWGNCGPYGRTYGRIGDYDPYDYIKGGRQNLHDAIAAIRRAGVPVGLYIEGYLLDERGKLGREHARDWQIIDAGGTGKRWLNGSEIFVCPAVQAWRSIQATTYATKCRELDIDGMYIDEFGFTGTEKDCYSGKHGHAVPSYPVLTELDTTRAVRQAVEAAKHGVALYTEESPCDVTSQYQDGSFTYAMSECRGRGAKVPLNLFRFAVPDFKTFEILICDKPTGSWATGVRWVFFNGEGIWLEGPANEWFAPETLAEIRRCHAILREHRDAFTSDEPRPLVPTLAGNVFANYFPARGKEVWTLYNARHRTVRGEVLSVEHRPGWKWHDAWNNRSGEVRRDGAFDIVLTSLGPHGVGCVVRSASIGEDH